MDDTNQSDDVDPSVQFLYNTMLQRDPKKRKVKLVEKHLIQVDFGLEDSDDDSDFEVGDHKEDSDDEMESDGGEGKDSDDGGNSEDEDEESDENSEKESKLDDDDDLVENSLDSDFVATSTSARQKNLKLTICCVCLGDVNVEDDEIVECDNCGVSVHEGCYGISENQSTTSTVSSASTEPWFCDACKAGCNPACELCPNPGGIFKETDAGKWVHLVCALYTPGVAFGDVDKLSPVTLFEMSYSRWGARECSLCEDPRFSRTGVCIGCDAGMCRTYFHVTCAQKEGLLSEAAPDECMDIADPFFAYCKMHADKHMARAKRRNWLAIQSHIRKHPDNKIEDEKEKSRFERKLNRHRQKFHIGKARRPPAWVPPQKLVRFLTSSPSCVRKMLRKAELMGIITQETHVANEKQEVRKKSHVPAALSVEFVSYFLERNNKIDRMKAGIKETMVQNRKLQEQEKILRTQYDQLYAEVDDLRESGTVMRNEGEKLWNILNGLTKKNLPLPDVFKVKKSPAKLVIPTRRENTSGRGSQLLHSPNMLIHKCAVCKKSTDPHMQVKCDNCKLHYHLECLDPPLTRMPKKTKLMGWQCSECDKSSSDEQEVPAEELEAPRKLREKIKEPSKWADDVHYEFAKLTKYKMKKKKPKKIKKPDMDSTDSQDKVIETKDKIIETKDKMIVDLAKNIKTKKLITPVRKQPEAKEVECVVCCKPGTLSNTVRCDECRLQYHFGCLDPPMKKTPKQRGYSWHCEACDPTDDSDEEEMDVEGAND